MSRTIGTVLVAAMLVLAGCAGGLSGGGDGGDGGDGTGTMQFYISDEQNAIDDFEHLNATITKIGVHRVGNNSSEDGEWVEYDINDTTVDLTELQGKNATRIAEAELPNGTYNKVFVHVSNVEGTLTSGESTNVKLPSSKLQMNINFTVGDGEEIDFVYDMTVFKAGNSGKYIIKPVVGESGTDQEIEEVDARAGGQGKAKAGSGQSGRMQFYLSDEKNAMGDFEHLNVTVTKIGFHKVDGEGAENETGAESENESENETEAEPEDDGEDDGEGGGEWVEYDVNDTTVDLTELQGANATKVADIPVPNGTYDKVFVYVSEVDGTLKNGESVNVKLPSSKLQLNTEFTVGDGEEVDFVYDMSVFKAGNSGKYILKPVVSESGTDKEIREVDPDEEDEPEDEREEEAETPLNATFVGNVTAGENATVEVTSNGSAVEGATVTYEDATYETGADGTATFPVPGDAEEVEVTVSYEGAEAELEAQAGSGGSAAGSGGTTATASG